MQSRVSDRLVVLSFLGLCCLAASPRPAAAQVVPDWAREAEASFWAALNSGNTRALKSMFATDAVFLHPDQEVRGPEMVEQFVIALLAAARYDCEWTIEGAYALDKLAAVSSSVTCTVVPTGGREPSTRPGQVLKVYQLQADGSWLIVRMYAEPPLEP